MPRVPLPLTDVDYSVMNCTYDRFSQTVLNLCKKAPQYYDYVVNATCRLAETDWITRTLENEIKAGRDLNEQEGLLWLQVHLLLTCADTLGHMVTSDGVKKRFNAFFRHLPQEAKQSLTEDILTWKTNRAELESLSLWDACTNTPVHPSCSQVAQSVQALTPDKRLEALMDFLYVWRNDYTHESEYPLLGYHPILKVMQRQRLNIPNTAQLGEYDRRHIMCAGNSIYYSYYKTDDVVATIRRCIVRGLGRMLGIA